MSACPGRIQTGFHCSLPEDGQKSGEMTFVPYTVFPIVFFSICHSAIMYMFLSFLFSVLKVCFESLRNVLASSDNQFGFKFFQVPMQLLYRQICCQRILWNFVLIPKANEPVQSCSTIWSWRSCSACLINNAYKPSWRHVRIPVQCRL